VDRELGRAPHVGARRVHLVAAPVVGHQGVIEVGVGMQAGRAGRLICVLSTVTRSLRSARWCLACDAHGAQNRHRCRHCWVCTHLPQATIAKAKSS
jgi:hypothetical protein